MPNIVEYQGPQNPEVRPSDLGEQSLFREARLTHEYGVEGGQRIKQGTAELADAAKGVMQQYAHSDITSTMSKFATTYNQLNDASEQFLKDPNLDVSDPALADKFMATAYEPAMDNIRQGVKTQEGMDKFNEHYNEFTMHFRQQFQRDLGSVANAHADAAVNNYITQQSSLIQRNPSALLPSLKVLDSTFSSILGSSPNITAADRAKLQTAYVNTARTKFEETAVGSIMLDPNGGPARAKQLLDAGEFPDIDGMKTNMAIKQSDVLLKQSANEGRAAQNFQREQQDRADMGTFLREGGTLDPATGRFVTNPGYVMNMLKSVGQPGGVSAEVAGRAIAYSQKPDDAVSGVGQLHTTLTGLMDGTLTDRQVIDKIGEPGGLSKADASFALSLYNNQDGGTRLLVQQTMKSAEQTLDPKTNLLPFGQGENSVKVTKFTAFMQDAIQTGMKNGMAVKQILDPNSPTYFLKGIDVNTDPRFQGTLAEQVSAAVPSSSSATAKAGARATTDNGPGSFSDRIMRLGEQSHDNDVSPSGAQSAMQVLPSTQNAPGFGVKPTADDSLAEKNRVGRDYANALKNHFSGSEVLAAAAYNAGPQRVHQWMTQIGDPRTGEISDQQWLSRIPDPTARAYVQRVTGGGAGMPYSPEQIQNIFKTGHP